MSALLVEPSAATSIRYRAVSSDGTARRRGESDLAKKELRSFAANQGSSGTEKTSRDHELATAPQHYDESLMKTSIKLVALLALGAAGVLSLPTGCAGTATRQSTGEYVDDAAITAKVKTAMVRDDTVKAMQVEVTTFKGNVQLSGFVDTETQKARAAQIAAGVEGVTNVTNNISVKSTAE